MQTWPTPRLLLCFDKTVVRMMWRCVSPGPVITPADSHLPLGYILSVTFCCAERLTVESLVSQRSS